MNPTSASQPKKRTWLDAVFTIIFVFLAGLIIINLAFPNDLVSIFGYGLFRVQTASMEPILMVNDYVIVERVNLDDLQPEDIIVFETEAQLTGVPVTQSIIVIHYFSHVDDDGHVLTYPAANRFLDEGDPSKYDAWGTLTSPHYVSADDIIGRQTQTIASAAFINDVATAFQTPWPYLGLAVVAGGIALVAVKKKKINPPSDDVA